MDSQRLKSLMFVVLHGYPLDGAKCKTARGINGYCRFASHHHPPILFILLSGHTVPLAVYAYRRVNRDFRFGSHSPRRYMSFCFDALRTDKSILGGGISAHNCSPFHCVHTRMNIDDGDDPRLRKRNSKWKCGVICIH